MIGAQSVKIKNFQSMPPAKSRRRNILKWWLGSKCEKTESLTLVIEFGVTDGIVDVASGRVTESIEEIDGQKLHSVSEN